MHVCSGVCWVDMHKLAERVELEELKKMGLLQGEVDQMMEVCVHLLMVCYTGRLEYLYSSALFYSYMQ